MKRYQNEILKYQQLMLKYHHVKLKYQHVMLAKYHYVMMMYQYIMFKYNNLCWSIKYHHIMKIDYPHKAVEESINLSKNIHTVLSWPRHPKFKLWDIYTQSFDCSHCIWNLNNYVINKTTIFQGIMALSLKEGKS